MTGYARSDTLRFASWGTVRTGWERTGWEETMARYRRSYSDQAAMDTLSFSDLSVQLLSGRHALAPGAWRRNFANLPSQGLLTLLFEKVTIDDGRAWRIVHDYTSSD